MIFHNESEELEAEGVVNARRRAQTPRSHDRDALSSQRLH
jgi:hypothetical protein